MEGVSESDYSVAFCGKEDPERAFYGRFACRDRVEGIKLILTESQSGFAGRNTPYKFDEAHCSLQD